jgi:anti-sigma B factor antagonist
VGFSVGTRRLHEVTIIDVRGRFTLAEGQAVHDLLVDLFRDGQRRVVLNLQDVSYLDSSGLGQLVRGLYTAERQGGELKAIGLTARVEEVLKLANLYEMFSDFPDEQTALRSFSPGC